MPAPSSTSPVTHTSAESTEVHVYSRVKHSLSEIAHTIPAETTSNLTKEVAKRRDITQTQGGKLPQTSAHYECNELPQLPKKISKALVSQRLANKNGHSSNSISEGRNVAPPPVSTKTSKVLGTSLPRPTVELQTPDVADACDSGVELFLEAFPLKGVLKGKSRTKGPESLSAANLESLNASNSPASRSSNVPAIKISDAPEMTTETSNQQSGPTKLKFGWKERAPRVKRQAMFSADEYVQKIWVAESSAATSIMSTRTKQQLQSGFGGFVWQDRSLNLVGSFAQAGKSGGLRELMR